MSKFVKILLLILLNVIVSASVTYAVLYYWDNIRKPDITYNLIPTIVQQAGNVQQTPEPSETEIQIEPVEETITEEPVTEPTEEAPVSEPTPVIRGAKVEIAIIRNPGNLAGEALRIVSNADEVVSLENWTLEDADGHLLKFPNIQLLRKGIFVEVYSRSGHTTPYEIYWNCDTSVWQSGETAVLRDVFGQIQATYRVP